MPQVSENAWRVWFLLQRLKVPTTMTLAETQQELRLPSKAALDRAIFELEDAGIIQDDEEV